MHICARTVDDLLRHSIEKALKEGDHINPSKGEARELRGVLLELTNPRARQSRTEGKGKVLSCLGEFLWYLSGTADMDFILYYLRKVYEKYRDLNGAYGPRLFKMRGKFNQIETVTRMLNARPPTRQAVIQLFDAADIADDYDDVPCTCTLQFFVRNGKLDMVTHMRSNDIFKGLPHDIFAFTMMQEIISRELGVDLGTYKHSVGSFHLYDEDKEKAQAYLNEGWQSTDRAMPEMPSGNQWAAIDKVLDAEKKIRNDITAKTDLESLHPYWADLVRLLLVFGVSKGAKTTERISESLSKISDIKSKMNAAVLSTFIEMREEELEYQLSQLKAAKEARD